LLASAIHLAAGDVTLVQQAQAAMPEFGPDVQFLAVTLGAAALG